MKFRALAKNYEAIQNILKSLMAATKLTSTLFFRISSNAIHLITDPACRSSPLLTRCELLKSALFDEYTFSGLTPEANLIYFEVPCDALSRILHSLQSNMKCFKIKLLNGRDGRFVLGIVAEYPTLESNRIISYQVYITMISKKLWYIFDDHPLNPVHLSFRLPSFKQISPTIERLAQLAQFAIISSKKIPNDYKAYFAIGLCNDSITIKSKFNDLELDREYPESNQNDSNDMETTYKVRIDIRRLNQIFTALASMKPTAINCKISNENAICIHFFNDLTNFKIILPNHDV